MSTPIVLNKKRLLLVEGKDECNFFTALLKHYKLELGIQVIEAGGISQFGSMLKNILLSSMQNRIKLQSLGVIRDADDSPESALQSVKNALRNNTLPCPEFPAQFTGERPRVGIFVLPSGDTSGNLETLCRCSVENNHKAACADDDIRCLKKDTIKSEDKAFAHAYLAAGDDPMARVGEGALAGVWDFEHEMFKPLIRFLKGIYE